MNCLKVGFPMITCATLIAACVSLAPGADQVRITKKPQDVAACTAVGNIKVSVNADGTVDIVNAEREFRNQTVGLGGNVALVTYGPISAPSQGIAYHCS